MTLVQDIQDKTATLPRKWTPAWGGLHPYEFGGGFTLDWDYPWKMTLANGKQVLFGSYEQQHEFVYNACTYFMKQNKKHLSVL